MELTQNVNQKLFDVNYYSVTFATVSSSIFILAFPAVDLNLSFFCHPQVCLIRAAAKQQTRARLCKRQTQRTSNPCWAWLPWVLCPSTRRGVTSWPCLRLLTITYHFQQTLRKSGMLCISTCLLELLYVHVLLQNATLCPGYLGRLKIMLACECSLVGLAECDMGSASHSTLSSLLILGLYPTSEPGVQVH